MDRVFIFYLNNFFYSGINNLFLEKNGSRYIFSSLRYLVLTFVHYLMLYPLYKHKDLINKKKKTKKIILIYLCTSITLDLYNCIFLVLYFKFITETNILSHVNSLEIL
jgi:hypothetical protein